MYFLNSKSVFLVVFTDAGDGMWTYGPVSQCVVENRQPDSHCDHPKLPRRYCRLGAGSGKRSCQSEAR